MAMFSKDLGIDLGTMYTRIADPGQVLLEEPTIVAIEVQEQKMVAVGAEARDMIGRVPDTIEVARPLKNGVIADYEVTADPALLPAAARQRRDALHAPARDDLGPVWRDQRGTPGGVRGGDGGGQP